MSHFKIDGNTAISKFDTDTVITFQFHDDNQSVSIERFSDADGNNIGHEFNVHQEQQVSDEILQQLKDDANIY